MSDLDPTLGRHGFTLIEVVVALLIFGLAFAVVARIIQTGVLQSGRAEAMTTATLLARSQLARIDADVPVAEGELGGDAGDGFHWRIVIRPAVLENERGDVPEGSGRRPKILPYQVEVTVAWGCGLGRGGGDAHEPAPSDGARAMTRRRAPAERGFTLLEILVAVTLLGLLMTALLGGVRLGVRAWETSGSRLDEDARLGAVQDFMRERLTQARLFEASAAAIGTSPPFRGELDRLSFVTLMPDHLGAGFQRMILALSKTHDGAADLSVEWWPADLGEDPVPQAMPCTAACCSPTSRNSALPISARSRPCSRRSGPRSGISRCCRSWSVFSCAFRTGMSAAGPI